MGIPQKDLATPTFLPVENSLILFLNRGCRGDRLHYKAKEGVVRSVWEQRPELTNILQQGRGGERERGGWGEGGR